MNESEVFHAVIHLSISASDAKTLPVLVEMDDPENPSISFSVAKFARYLQREGKYSYESIYKKVGALGKLRDFYRINYKDIELPKSQLRSLLEDFLFAFDHGFAPYERPASNQQYQIARSAIFEYVKYLIDFEGGTWNEHEVNFVDACCKSWESLAHAKKSLLFHTKKRAKKKTGGRKKKLSGLKHFKPFPPDLIEPLIEQTKNPRDKLLYSFMAFGGRRLSEMLHLFVQDVSTIGDQLDVKLLHPSLSRMGWVNKSGKSVIGQRREYLKTLFALLPRTEHGAMSTAAGWKGIKFDDEAKLESQIYWLPAFEGPLLSQHRNYLYGFRDTAPRRPHPYYFISEDGQPLKIKAAEKQFSLACKRLEKKLGANLDGYGLHSLRHYYGYYCTDVLRLDLLFTQKYMGHAQITTTAIYSHITPETAAAELKRAEKNRSPSTSAGREGMRSEAPQSAPGIDSSYLQKHGSTAFGDLDLRKLSRKLK